jgi:predicted transcriptional regulator
MISTVMKNTPEVYKPKLDYEDLAIKVNRISSNIDMRFTKVRYGLEILAENLAGNIFRETIEGETKGLHKAHKTIKNIIASMNEYNLEPPYQLKEIQKNIDMALNQLDRAKSG